MPRTKRALLATPRRIKTGIGKASWVHVDKPAENLSNVLEYSLGLVLSNEQILPIQDAVAEMIAEAAENDPSFGSGKVNDPFKPAKEYNKDGELVPIKGCLTLACKRRTTRFRNGEKVPNTPPLIVDRDGVPLDPVPEVGSGTLLRAAISLYAYSKAGQKGIGAGLEAVQIVELAAREDVFTAIDEDAWSNAPEAVQEARRALAHPSAGDEPDDEEAPF